MIYYQPIFNKTSPTAHDTNSSEEFRTQTKLRRKRMFSHSSLPQQAVTDNRCQMCFSTARGICRVMECI